MDSPEYTFDLKRFLENVPACLREPPQWVGWKYIVRSGGKRTKCPISPTKGGKASSTDPKSWGVFENALEMLRLSPNIAGLGFVFAKEDPFAGIDLDSCRDPCTGVIKPWALAIIAQLASYTEVSPSGTGVKIIIRAKKNGDRCRTAYEDGAIEMYDRDRFFTITGQRLTDTPTDVEDRQAQFDLVHELVFGGAIAPKPAMSKAPVMASGDGRAPLDDDNIIKIALRSKKSGETFKALWEGRWQKQFGSQSESDSSLVFRLAFYTKDAAQIDRLFRRSGLMRDKWNEKHGSQTYGEMTIARALENVTSQYAPRNSGTNRRVRPNPLGESLLPDIITSDTQLRELTDIALDALNQGNAPPFLFVRSGSLVRIGTDEKHIPKIECLDRIRVRCHLAETANFFEMKRAGDTVYQEPAFPPLPLAENILAKGRWPFPALAGLARAPIVRPDGSICTMPGYDAQSHLLYAPDPGLKLSEIPEFPKTQEIRACVDSLLAVINDFPFADQASRANALSILFSVILRPVINGHIPLAILDAPTQGTGKTLLATVLVHIAVGRIASESVPSKLNEDEWRKKITTVLMTSAPVILLDNVPDNTAIDSSALAAALTSHEWSDRRLGKNETIRVPSKAVWIATGNNLRVAGDMPRRSYCVRLDAQAERPWERSGFRIPDLEAHVSENRGQLLTAALTIVRGWFAAQCPRVKMRPFGSFDEWAGVVGSVMGYAGIDGFLENLDQTRLVQDEDNQQWGVVFEAWWNRFGQTVVTVSELFGAFFAEGADPIDIPEILMVQKDRGEGSLRRSLGKQFSRLSGRVFNGRKLCVAGGDTHRKVRAWALRPVHVSENGEANPAHPAICGVSFHETPQPE